VPGAADVADGTGETGMVDGTGETGMASGTGGPGRDGGHRIGLRQPGLGQAADRAGYAGGTVQTAPVSAPETRAAYLASAPLV